VVELDGDSPELAQRASAIRRWIAQANANRAALSELLAAVRDYRIPLPSSDHDSMVEYDRRRMTKESLLERAIATSVDMAGAARLLAATLTCLDEPPTTAGEEQRQIVSLLCALLKRDRQAAASLCPALRTLLAKEPLLYVPLAKGGNPDEIVAVRVRQHALQDLLAWLPRLGLWIETCELLESAREME